MSQPQQFPLQKRQQISYMTFESHTHRSRMHSVAGVSPCRTDQRCTGDSNPVTSDHLLQGTDHAPTTLSQAWTRTVRNTPSTQRWWYPPETCTIQPANASRWNMTQERHWYLKCEMLLSLVHGMFLVMQSIMSVTAIFAVTASSDYFSSK